MNQSGDDPRLTLLDRVVFLVAAAMDWLGLNGTRLRWRWNQKRLHLAESGLRAELLWRSARGQHKMCPSCRALVPRGARTCQACGAPLAHVRAPGVGRLLANVLPGATATTSLILLANGFWFVIMMMAQMKVGAGGFGILSHFGGELLYRFGSGFSVATLYGEWWRIVTPIFLHGGLLHFFFNSYVLLQVGPIVEGEFGTERFWVMYLLCGVAGSAASQFGSDLLRGHPINTVGASGAIMGLMGLLLVHGWRSGGAHGRAMRGTMLRYAIFIMVFSLLPGIDMINHAGGLACGALLGLLVPSGPLRDRPSAALWKTAALLGVVLVVYCFYKVASASLA